MKSYKIYFLEEAENNLEDIRLKAILTNSAGAQSFMDELTDKINLLSDFPNMGTHDNSSNLDFIYHYPYFIYHIVNHDTKTIDIVSIWHGARGYYK